MKILRALVPIMVLSVMALAPFGVHAADVTTPLSPGWSIVPAQCHCDAAHNQDQPGVDSAPDFRCVAQTGLNLMNFAMALGTIIFVLVASYAGFLFMFSPINAHNKEMARTVLGNAVVGLMLALSAWLIVDFVMSVLYNKAWGPWHSLLAGEGTRACLEVITPPAGVNPTDTGTVTSTNGTPSTFSVGDHVECNKGNTGTFVAATVTAASGSKVSVQYGDGSSEEDIAASLCRTPGATGTPTSNWQSFFGFQGGIASQVGQASGALTSTLSCMANKLSSDGHTNVSQISSISDSLIVSGSKTWAQCRAGQCAHCGTGNNNACGPGGASYHYGGTKCGDQSYAVDFAADPGTSAANLLTQAAQQCGATKIIPEGSPAHTHIQVGQCN